jgi:hypothetical protein
MSRSRPVARLTILRSYLYVQAPWSVYRTILKRTPNNCFVTRSDTINRCIIVSKQHVSIRFVWSNRIYLRCYLRCALYLSSVLFVFLTDVLSSDHLFWDSTAEKWVWNLKSVHCHPWIRCSWMCVQRSVLRAQIIEMTIIHAWEKVYRALFHTWVCKWCTVKPV